MMTIDEKLTRLRAHRNNIHRYRRLLTTHLSGLERTYIYRRLSEERASLEALTQKTFPFTLPAVQCATANDGQESRDV